METRIGYDKNRKHFSFKTDGQYFKPLSRDTSGIFNNGCSQFAAAILYTKLVNDKGYKIVNRFGTDVIEEYDNGIVGYQCINYYNSVEEANKEFEDIKRVSPKIGVIAYVDVWLAVNNNK